MDSNTTPQLELDETAEFFYRGILTDKKVRVHPSSTGNK